MKIINTYIFIFFIPFLIINVAFSQYNPNNISSLVLWISLDQGISLSDTVVAKWEDLSGNSNNFYQNLSSQSPTIM